MAKRVINTDIWNDTTWRKELKDINVRYLWMYLLTNQNTNISGIYHIPTDLIRFDTQMPLEAINNGLNKLMKCNLCYYSFETEEIAIFDFPRDNINKLYNGIDRSITYNLERVKDKSLIDKMIASLSQYPDELSMKIVSFYGKEKSIKEKENNNKNKNTNNNTNINKNNNINNNIKNKEKKECEKKGNDDDPF